MKERIVRVETIRSHMMCECGGEFVCKDDAAEIFAVIFSNLNENGYTHTCTKCGKQETFEIRYPKTIELEIPIKLKKDKQNNFYTFTDVSQTSGEGETTI